MAKRSRKTRREKKVADKRHTLYHLDNPAQETKPVEEKTVKPSTHQRPNSKPAVSYAYVAKDVRKILIVTSIIIIVQLAIFFILNRV